MNKLEYFLDDIESCELIGKFEDEYVYDVEVEDETHTFIANDILVHNSLFVSFEPCMQHCEWQNLVLPHIDRFQKPFIILENRQETKTENPNCLQIFRSVFDMKEWLKTNEVQTIIIDGYFVKSRDLNKVDELKELLKDKKVVWNWNNELDFIQGVDFFRYGGYFKMCLEEYAESNGAIS